MSGADKADLEPIAVPYLLASGIPCFVDAQGRRWTDSLWHKDLVEHLRYIGDFTLASPLREEAPPAGATCLTDDERFDAVRFVDLPASDSFLAGVFNWPSVFARLWDAVGRARVVHAGVADWPIPTGWAATVAARLRGRSLVINIESAFWRVDSTAPLKKRLRASAWEAVNRWCVRRATMPMFTQANYAEQMLRDPSRGYVLHASWIDQDTILTDAQAKTAWDRKQAEEPLALLFAGRLIASKGIADLLEAVADASMPMRLDVIGEGELKHEVVAAAASGKVRLLEPVAYGPEFFDLLRRYHALVVPSRSDEQPRIVYDAYSQAVPVIGTRTAGILACVAEGKTGWLAPIADVAGLRATIQRAEGDRAALRRMGMEGLHFARKYTHREMHRRRRIALGKALGI